MNICYISNPTNNLTTTLLTTKQQIESLLS